MCHLWLKRGSRLGSNVFLLVCILLLTGCSLFGGNPAPKPDVVRPDSSPDTVMQLDPTLHAVELDMLNNIRQYGFNNDPSINNGLGGLWVNWRYGTNPLQTNVNGTGESDDSGSDPRHDALTDLRYIHNLWSYKVQNPSDASFDSEIARYTPIVKYEFAHTHNERAWLYDEFNALFTLSHDTFYKNAALSLAKSYAKAFDPKVGSVYKVNSEHPLGSYRVDLTLETGCALLQAGVQFNNALWRQEGQSIVDFVYTHAYISRYHAFPDQVDNVLLPDGSVNAQESFFEGRLRNYVVYGRYMQMGNISQIIISLLDAYVLTHDRDLLNKATDLLDSLSLPDNPLGIWDTTYGGYYFSVSFTGISPRQPGEIVLDKKRKEAGRQAIMLQAFHLANQFTNNKYGTMESQMRGVTLKHIYNPSIHGVPYLVNADWSAPTFHNGALNNMTTTEAMGATLESLFSLAS